MTEQTKTNVSRFFVSILFLIVYLGSVGGVLWYTNKHVYQPSQEEVWAKAHTKEVRWAMDRYTRIQAAAQQMYFADDTGK